jgi:hypothetical protein
MKHVIYLGVALFALVLMLVYAFFPEKKEKIA